MCWGGMNDAGVNGGTAYTNENDGKQSQILSKGKQHQQDRNANDPFSNPNHTAVRNFHGDKAADASSHGDANEKQTGKSGCCNGVNVLDRNQIAACPEAHGLFNSRIEEKANCNCFRTWQP